MSMPASVEWAPLVRLASLGALLAIAPLAWWWLRYRGGQAAQRQRGLTLLTLFLTFDLVLFGAFTRLTDSGLGCPDWPGCYGAASPIGARPEIAAAESAMPTGPVTLQKAWIEMIHRYLASALGVLILVLAASSWVAARRGQRTISPWWPTLTLVWVGVQGAFGALTVTMKLYPAIVTLHLLGGMGLLALLTAQAQCYLPRPIALAPLLRLAVWAVAGLTLVQLALGGWVSTNYAVMACADFPRCNGQWWPAMDFVRGFELRRELGFQGDGNLLTLPALTAIHYAHRLMAYLLLVALAGLAWALRTQGEPDLRRWAFGFAALAAWQLASGLSNVLLGWPLLGAVAHTSGAAALVVLLTAFAVRSARSGSTTSPRGHGLPEPPAPLPSS